MNNDKIKRLQEAYFEGKLSKEDEKWLKENSDDAYFKALNETKKEEMDWSFEEFLSVVEEPAPKTMTFSYRNYYWAAASVVLIVFSTFFFIMSGEKEEKPQYAKLDSKEEPKNEIVPEVIEEPKEKPIPTTTKKVTPKKAPISEEPAYNPEYVVINGKPVYDLEEAKELTMNSLNLLASNVEKSVSGMENVKHLSIKF